MSHPSGSDFHISFPGKHLTTGQSKCQKLGIKCWNNLLLAFWIQSRPHSYEGKGTRKGCFEEGVKKLLGGREEAGQVKAEVRLVCVSAGFKHSCWGGEAAQNKLTN